MDKKTSIWKIASKKADFYEIGKTFSIDPVIARIIRNRDITKIEDFNKFLNPKIEDINSPNLLKDMDIAVSKLIDCINQKEKIRIVGDYDTDGTCATWILFSGIKALTNLVDYDIPNRVTDGYGINKEIIAQSKEDGVSLIITCDNGIAAIDELEYADELGIDVIVTDHHQLIKDENEKDGYRLPKAVAVVNPHRWDCVYPFKNICGANIAFKLIQSLYQSLDITEKSETLEELRFFASIATIGDMMPLIDENRALVKYALFNFKKCRNLGLRMLCQNLNIDLSNLRAYDVGFKISPCINAGGRLDTARLVLKLFSAQTQEQAKQIADELIELNSKRKEMTLKQSLQAFEIIDRMDESNKVIIVYLPKCHESIAGIVASRIKESYHRPTLVVTRAAKGLKGSARSITAYSMYEEMAKCRDLFSHFGGHKMAAGFSLPEENLTDLIRRLNQNCTLSEEELAEEIVLDMELPLDYLSIPLIKELELLEPFGMGNHKPMFGTRNIGILTIRQIGKNKEYLKLGVCSEKGRKIEALCFDTADELTKALMQKCEVNSFEALLQNPKLSKIRLDLIYYPSVNSYMGNESIQLLIQKFRF